MFKYKLGQKVKSKLFNREGFIYSRVDSHPKNSQDKYLIKYDDCAGCEEDDYYIPLDEFESSFYLL